MPLLSIRPLTKLLTDTPERKNIKLNDLRQVWARIDNQRQQKLAEPRRGRRLTTEEKVFGAGGAVDDAF